MAFADFIAPILEKRDLTAEEVKILANYLVTEATPSQIGSALTGLTVRGVSGAELAGFVAALREQMITVPVNSDHFIDTCGTGGGMPSFNISTAASIIAAAAGAKVAKHGNRAVTSQCGSADVLESLGVHLHSDPMSAKFALEINGFAFLLAPKFHPSLAHVGPTRRELGFRTIFNVMGPMLNPAGAKRQSMGVFNVEWVSVVADALARLDTEKALVVHGSGIDEISPLGGTTVAIVEKGLVKHVEWTPATFGLEPVDIRAMQPGDSIAENGVILKEAISDSTSDRFRVVLPSAAAAVWLAGLADTLHEAVELATATVSSGKASAKLLDLTLAGPGLLTN